MTRPLTDNMVSLLSMLVALDEVSGAGWPLGGKECPRHSVGGLLRRGLVTVSGVGDERRVSVNAKGKIALRNYKSNW